MTAKHVSGRSRLILSLLVAAALAWLTASATVPRATASVQEPQLGLPDSPRNLQVLPADMSTREVVSMMRGFSQGLGVRCIHCHLGDDPRDLETVDFSSDARPAKQKARVMLQMVQEINRNHVPKLAALGSDADSLIQVTCATCHHGQARPRTLVDVLAEAAGKGGAVMAIAEYDRLRQRFYGGWTYDFGEGTLLALAEQLANAGEVDDAFAVIDKNLEVFPDSFGSYISRAQIQLRAGNTDAAMATLDACVADLADPGFCAQAKTQFQQRQQRPRP